MFRSKKFLKTGQHTNLNRIQKVVECWMHHPHLRGRGHLNGWLQKLKMWLHICLSACKSFSNWICAILNSLQCLADISFFYFLANSYLCTTVIVSNLGTTLQIGQLVKPKLILGPLHRAVSTALPKDDVRIDSTAIKKVQLQKAFKTERQKDK